MGFVRDTIIEPVVGTFFGGAESEAADVSQESQQQAGAFLAAGFEPSQQALQESFAETEFGLKLLGAQPAAFTPEDLPPGLEPSGQVAGASLQKRQSFSGALGEDAQREAFRQFEESPGVAFLREQGLRLAGSKSGIGGVGGDRLRELTKFGQGLALQDFENQFRRLGETQRGEELLSGRFQQERMFGAGQQEGARRFRESQRFAADEGAAARRQQAVIEMGRARGLNTAQIEDIRQQMLINQANTITGAGAAEAAGITSSAAGARAGLTQIAGGVVGGVAGGPLGALAGAFGV